MIREKNELRKQDGGKVASGPDPKKKGKQNSQTALFFQEKKTSESRVSSGLENLRLSQLQTRQVFESQTPEALFRTSVSKLGKNEELGSALFLNRRKTELFSSEIDTKSTRPSNKMSLISKKKFQDKPVLGSKNGDSIRENATISEGLQASPQNLARYGSDGNIRLYPAQKKDKPHSKNKSTLHLFRSVEDQSVKHSAFDGISHHKSGEQFLKLFERGKQS